MRFCISFCIVSWDRRLQKCSLYSIFSFNLCFWSVSRKLPNWLAINHRNWLILTHFSSSDLQQTWEQIEFWGQIVSETHFNLLDPVLVFQKQIIELLPLGSLIIAMDHSDLCIPDWGPLFLQLFFLSSFVVLSGLPSSVLILRFSVTAPLPCSGLSSCRQSVIFPVFCWL